MFRRIFSLMGKEFRQFFRNIPLVAVVIFAMTIDPYSAGELSFDLEDYRLAVVDLDKSTASAEFVKRLRPPYFRITEFFEGFDRMREVLVSGEAQMVIVIPEGFERDLHRRRSSQVQLVMDGTGANSATVALSYIAGIANEYSEEVILSTWKLPEGTTESLPLVIDQTRVLYNPNLNDTWFIVLSEFLTAITLISILLPAAAAVYEKQTGTMEQLIVTPLRVYEIMIAKIIPMAVIILGATFLGVYTVITVGRGVPLKGSIIYFAFVTLVFLFTSSGLGLLISTVARNLAETLLITFIVLIPVIFLSGTWTPPEAMPGWMQQLIHFSPLKYYLEISYGIFFRGVGLAETWIQLLILLGLGLIIFAAGAFRFRRKFA